MSATVVGHAHARESIQFAIELSTNKDHLRIYNILSRLLLDNELLDNDLRVHYYNTKQLGTKDPQHDAGHTMSVVYNTFNLIKLGLDTSNMEALICNNYSREVLAICMYHDLFDHKFENKYENIKERITETLTSIGFTEDQIETVMEVSINIGFTKQKENKLIEYSKIPKIRKTIKSWVSAGDLIEAIGINGIIRAFNCVELLSTTVYKDEKIETGDYKHYLRLVIEHMEDKLLIVRDNYIEPSIAKEVTEPLQLEMEAFYSKYKMDPDKCLEDIVKYVGKNARYRPCGIQIFD